METRSRVKKREKEMEIDNPSEEEEEELENSEESYSDWERQWLEEVMEEGYAAGGFGQGLEVKNH